MLFFFTLDYVSILFVLLKCMHRMRLPSKAFHLVVFGLNVVSL